MLASYLIVKNQWKRFKSKSMRMKSRQTLLKENQLNSMLLMRRK